MIRQGGVTREMAEMRGGKGVVKFHDISTLEEMYGKNRIFAKLVLEPGCSIGRHPHEADREFFYILSGTPTVDDDGVEKVLQPGDIMVTGDGACHSVENRTDSAVEFIALVVNK